MTWKEERKGIRKYGRKEIRQEIRKEENKEIRRKGREQKRDEGNKTIKRREEYKEVRKEGNKSSTVCELAKRDCLLPRKNQTPGRKQTVFRKLYANVTDTLPAINYIDVKTTSVRLITVPVKLQETALLSILSTTLNKSQIHL